MKTILIICALILILLLVAYLIGDFLLGLSIRRKGSLSAATGRQKVMGSGWSDLKPLKEKGNQWFRETPSEKLYMTGREGLKLCGTYFRHGSGAKATFLLFHGYRSGAEFDLSYAAERLYESDYDVIMVTHRAHGDSEGDYICFGQKEGIDAADWANYMVREAKCVTPVYLYGVSMGATTVMMSVNQGLPEEVRGLVLDCGFACIGDIFKSMMKSGFHLSPKLFPAVNWMFRRKTGCDLERSTVDDMKKCSLPVLFVHGTEDHFVPASMSRENYEASAAQDKNLILVEGAHHGQSFYLDTEHILQEIRELVERTATDH